MRSPAQPNAIASPKYPHKQAHRIRRDDGGYQRRAQHIVGHRLARQQLTEIAFGVYKVRPEVPGDIIMQSTIDHTVNPFNRWLGDNIAASLGNFIVTERFLERLESFAGTGYVFDKVRRLSLGLTGVLIP